MYKIEVVEDIERIYELEAQWEYLLSQNPVIDITMTIESIVVWWRHFAEKHRLLCILIREGDKIIGIAPLMLVAHRYLGITLHVIKFIGTEPSNTKGRYIFTGIGGRYGNINGFDFIVKKGCEEIFINTLFSFLENNFTSWNIIDLHGIHDTSAVLPILNKRLSNNYIFNIKTPTRVYYLKVINNSIDYYIKKRSKNFRKNIMNTSTKLIKRWNPIFNLYLNNHIIEDEIAVARDIDSRSRKNREGKTVFKERKFCNFYREWISAMDKKGRLLFALIKDGDMPVVYELGFSYKDMIFLYNGGYDKGYYKLSPGTLLSWWMLCGLIEKGYKTFNWGRGDTEKKRSFCDEFTNFNQLMIFKKRAVPLWIYFLEFIMKPGLKKVIKLGLPFYIMIEICIS